LAQPGVGGLAVAGVAGGLVEGTRPGTVVVADRVLREDGREVAAPGGARMIAGELRRLGLPVAIGAVVSTTTVVHGRDRRAALARLGAVAVDTESAYALASGWDIPTAVLRVVVDTPDRELRSPATIGGGITALRHLRAAAPVLARWADSVAARTVLLAGPRSFCAGVERAIATVERAIDRYGEPVYVRRQIVHNRHVVADLERRGAVFVEELDQVPDGATVILSAHGVSPQVRTEASGRDLKVIDATCPLVSKVHHEVRRFSQKGYRIVMIGHAGHDETEGTLGEAEGISLITSRDDVARLEVDDPEKLAYITQTTLSPDDVAGIVSELSHRFPAVVGPHAADICYATQNRQDAVAAMAAECDVVLVLGSSNSSNAARLVEVAERAGAASVLIEDESELPLALIGPARVVGVTAAASTPPQLVERLVGALATLGATTVEERRTSTENVNFPLPVEVR
jgi:4-hydroxy-3-methylbut-2-enyl diphosphate reductase